MCVCVFGEQWGSWRKIVKKNWKEEESWRPKWFTFYCIVLFSAFERRNILQSSSAEEAEYMLILLIKRNKQDRNERLYGLEKKAVKCFALFLFLLKITFKQTLLVLCWVYWTKQQANTGWINGFGFNLHTLQRVLSAVNGFKLKIHTQNKYKNKPPTINSIQLIWQRVISSVICQHRHRYTSAKFM